jgi:type I restriction enzyme M protein
MNLMLQKIDRYKRSTWTDPTHPTELELDELYRARRELLSNSVVGFDLNPSLVRAAKMNMVMNNDGSGGLAQADSLRDPITWSEEAGRLGSLQSFDYVFTNPPFGTNIKIDSTEVLRQFELAAVWDWDQHQRRWVKRLDASGEPILQSSQPPEILFIERCVQFLKPGSGKMAMVIPNGILNNPPLGYIRQWIMDNCQILAVVDMQRDLFQPRNDTQTSMVVLRKFSSEEKLKAIDYAIFFAVTNKIGHDKRGNTIYVRDEEGNDILEEEEVEVTTVSGNGLSSRKIKEKVRVVDDQLPKVPAIFHKWRSSHGVVL